MLKLQRIADIVRFITVILGNPDTAQAFVTNVVKAPLDLIIEAEPDFFPELRAAYLMTTGRSTAKESSTAFTFSETLYTHRFRFRPQYHDVFLRRLRRFANKERIYEVSGRDLDYAADYPQSNAVLEWLKQAPPSTRAHVLVTLDWMQERGKPVISLKDTTHYGLREFGIDIDASSKALRESGIFQRPTDLLKIAKSVGAEELAEMASATGLPLNPRYPKKKILEIVGQHPEFLNRIKAFADDNGLVEIAAQNQALAEQARTFQKTNAPRCDMLALNISTVG